MGFLSSLFGSQRKVRCAVLPPPTITPPATQEDWAGHCGNQSRANDPGDQNNGKRNPEKIPSVENKSTRPGVAREDEILLNQAHPEIVRPECPITVFGHNSRMPLTSMQ